MGITDATLKYIAVNCPNLNYFEMGGATHNILLIIKINNILLFYFIIIIFDFSE